MGQNMNLQSLIPIAGAFAGSELGGAFDKPAKRHQSPLEQMVVWSLEHPGQKIPVPKSVQEGGPLIDISAPQQQQGLMNNPIVMAMLMQALGGTRQSSAPASAQQPAAPMQQQTPATPGLGFVPPDSGGFETQPGSPNYIPDSSMLGASSMVGSGAAGPSALSNTDQALLGGVTPQDLQAMGQANLSFAPMDTTFSPDEFALLYPQYGG